MAIEVPDWYRTVALVGVDITGTPVVVLLDSTGAIMAVMKGEYAGTLKNIAVDGSGRIVSVIRDPTSDNYIAIDANGYIAAVLKATYSGTLKNVACDSEGRIIMIPTDPADVWGNAISMGNAELAAVLSFAKRFDRRGTVLWLDGFEDGLNKWTLGTSGTGATGSISAKYARTGAYSAYLKAGSDASLYASIYRVQPFPVKGKIGYEVSWSYEPDLSTIEFYLALTDGTNLIRGRVRYNAVDDDFEYYNTGGTWTDIDSNIELYVGNDIFHTVKFVIDLDAGKYVRAFLNDKEYDLSTISYYTTLSGVAKNMACWVMVYSISGVNAEVYVDDVILTQNEPA